MWFLSSSSSAYFLPTRENQPLLCQSLCRLIQRRKKEDESLILLCIGTDKITGDCLGPLVGTKLVKQHFPFPVYGTLAHPVHAVNFMPVLRDLHREHPCPFLLAIDASMGSADAIGSVSLSSRPLYPGSGVCRSLPPVGEVSLTGIIGEASASGEAVLPDVRLRTVNLLADFIVEAVLAASSFISQS